MSMVTIHVHLCPTVSTEYIITIRSELVASWCYGRPSDSRSRGRAFKSRPGTMAQKLWASFSHLCASVTKQYNVVPAKAGE